MFDGTVASTKTRTDSEKRFGIQIDSLSDLISFGVLPGVIVYMVSEKNPWVGMVASVFVLCSLLGGSFRPNLETLDSGYFSLDELPELADEKTNFEQIKMCFDAYYADHWQTLLD